MSYYIAIGFDETCVSSGRDIPGAVEALKRITAAGHRLCLWTCRYPHDVEKAVSWFASHGIPLEGANRWRGHGVRPSPKLVADLYVDDRGIGTPLISFHAKDVVDWSKVCVALQSRGLIGKRS